MSPYSQEENQSGRGPSHTDPVDRQQGQSPTRLDPRSLICRSCQHVGTPLWQINGIHLCNPCALRVLGTSANLSPTSPTTTTVSALPREMQRIVVHRRNRNRGNQDITRSQVAARSRTSISRSRNGHVMGAFSRDTSPCRNRNRRRQVPRQARNMEYVLCNVPTALAELLARLLSEVEQRQSAQRESRG